MSQADSNQMEQTGSSSQAVYVSDQTPLLNAVGRRPQSSGVALIVLLVIASVSCLSVHASPYILDQYEGSQAPSPLVDFSSSGPTDLQELLTNTAGVLSEFSGPEVEQPSEMMSNTGLEASMVDSQQPQSKASSLPNELANGSGRSHSEKAGTRRLGYLLSRQRRSGISDQRLQELATYLAVKKFRESHSGRRHPVAFGLFDPARIGRRR